MHRRHHVKRIPIFLVIKCISFHHQCVHSNTHLCYFILMLMSSTFSDQFFCTTLQFCCQYYFIIHVQTIVDHPYCHVQSSVVICSWVQSSVVLCSHGQSWVVLGSPDQSWVVLCSPVQSCILYSFVQSCLVLRPYYMQSCVVQCSTFVVTCSP